MESQKIILANLSVSYFDLNPASPRSLLLLHGWGADSRSWSLVAGNLPQNLRVVIPDLPGFGASSIPPPSFTLSDYAAVVGNLIQKLQLKNPVLIGHSFGGRIAVKLISLNPKLVSKLILVDSAGLKSGSKNIIRILAGFLKPLFRLPLLKNFRPPLLKIIASDDYLAAGPLAPVFKNILAENLRPLLAKITAPTLVIWGENDTVTPLAAAEIFNREIRNSRLAVIKNAGHFPFFDQPEEFIKILTAFLNPA